jgi:hypothetical protein
MSIASTAGMDAARAEATPWTHTLDSNIGRIAAGLSEKFAQSLNS